MRNHTPVIIGLLWLAGFAVGVGLARRLNANCTAPPMVTGFVTGKPLPGDRPLHWRTVTNLPPGVTQIVTEGWESDGRGIASSGGSTLPKCEGEDDTRVCDPDPITATPEKK